MSEIRKNTGASTKTGAPVKTAAPARVARPASSARTSGAAPAARTAGARPAATGAQRRPATGARPTGAASRTATAKRKPQKKKKSMLPLILLAALIVALVVGIVLISSGSSGKNDKTVNAGPTQSVGSNASSSASGFQLSDIEISNDPLPSDGGNSIVVSDLSITQGLDDKWLNVLLMGTDARSLIEPARTDTMIILSLNKETGDIKLASLQRDTNVTFEGHTKYGTRINNAYFYGGAQLAMKVVNETFGMNIQHYVIVDFNGFAKIADMIGGVDITITKGEMEQINHNVQEQYYIQYKQGKLDYDTAKQAFCDTVLQNYTTSGEKIHLDGMQTLGYARIRKLDSDFARTERQRNVLNALLEKMKGVSVATLTNTVITVVKDKFISTNIPVTDIVNYSRLVLERKEFKLAETLRLPIEGSYVSETRNNEAQLYDVDKNKNKLALYAFIYN